MSVHGRFGFYLQQMHAGSDTGAVTDLQAAQRRGSSGKGPPVPPASHWESGRSSCWRMLRRQGPLVLLLSLTAARVTLRPWRWRTWMLLRTCWSRRRQWQLHKTPSRR